MTRRDDEAYTGPTIPIRRPAAQPAREDPTRPLPRQPRRRRRAPWGAWLRTLALVLLAALGIALILAMLQVRELAAQSVVRELRPGLRAASPALPFTMLLIGVDERPGFPEEGVRGDTLIVARVDPVGGWVALLSIPRDTLADVPGLGASRINAAYGYGFNNAAELYGPEATPREAGMAHAAIAVEQFLGIPIDHTAQVNFDGFAGVVDALGGVTIDVPRPLIDDEYPTPDFGIMRVEFAAGPQHMDGARALIYARTRHADSDFGRAERQQQVLRAILDELRRRGPVGQALLLPRLRERIGGAVATTLPFDRPDALLGLARLASALRPDEIQRAQIAPDTVTLLSEEGGTLIWDEQGVRTLAQQLLRGPSAESEAARVQVLNGTAVSGLAGRVSNDLAGRGFSMLPAGDSPLAASRTVVYNLRNKPITARQLADLLRAELREGPPEGLASDADIVVVLGEDAAER